MKITVISPNISENMSGEAIKAFQYVKHLTKIGADLTIISHARSRGQFEEASPGARVIFIEDDFWQRNIWRTVLFRQMVTIPFFRRVRTLVKELSAEHPEMIFHYLCPVSPIYPRMPVKGVRNILGPLTGNIYFPPALKSREPFRLKWRRATHKPAQVLLKLFAGDKGKFDRILISGGARTAESLKWAGARDDQFRYVIDSGISDRIIARPAIQHEGPNYRFLCNGRMDPHKGVDLAVRAVAQTKKPITLDIFGKGDMEETVRALIEELGVGDRVTMRGWLPSHDDLLDEMMKFRGFVFPSMSEANGIVVQEALAMGLPVVCLNWGGPSVLTSDETARRIEPTSDEDIVAALAEEMDRLAEDPALATQRASAGLDHARAHFSWPAVADQWISNFD